MSIPVQMPSPVQPVESNGEPLGAVGTVVAFVGAVITLVVAFGIKLTADQITAILGLVSVSAPTAVWLIGRKKVSPFENVAILQNKNGDLVSGPASNMLPGIPVEVWTAAPDQAVGGV